MRSRQRIPTLTGAFALGASLMYVLDPARGRRRRAQAREKLLHSAHRATNALEAGSRDLSHRARGLVAEVRARLRPELVDDDVLAERVRSQMGRVVSHSGGIEVAARRGVVTLGGSLGAEEVEPLVARVRHVRGVRHVDNHLVARAHSGGLAPPHRPIWAWPPGVRLLVTLGGGSLLARSAFTRTGLLLGLGTLCASALFGGVRSARPVTAG